MQEYVDAGLTTFDMADIYGPAEEIFGQFNSQVLLHFILGKINEHNSMNDCDRTSCSI